MTLGFRSRESESSSHESIVAKKCTWGCPNLHRATSRHHRANKRLDIVLVLLQILVSSIEFLRRSSVISTFIFCRHEINRAHAYKIYSDSISDENYGLLLPQNINIIKWKKFKVQQSTPETPLSVSLFCSTENCCFKISLYNMTMGAL